MAQRRGGLGRGLDSLIREDPAKSAKPAAENTAKTAKTQPAVTAAPKKQDITSTKQEGDLVAKLRLSQVVPNREQPRKDFDAEAISELAESIKQFGVITPILVQKKGSYFEIIAGERRWRAAKEAKLKEIPAIVREYSDQEAVEVSLIENIQREDLSPIEEAKAYERLIQEFSLTQEAVAKRVSKSRSAVTNTMRLLRLPAEVQDMVAAEDISEGHARTLLGLEEPSQQIEAARRIVKENLSVRDTEKLVKQIVHPPVKKEKERSVSDLIYRDLEEQLKSALGTRVSIVSRGKTKGRIEIEYYSVPELERLVAMLKEAGRTGEGAH